jgi:hypothetical protein
MNINGLTKLTRTVGVFATKNSPTILTGLSVAGLLSTVAMAVSATPKAIRIIDELEDEYVHTGEPVTKKDILKATWKVYAPAAAMGAVTIGCIVGANSINLRRNAALASVYSISEMALKEYQAKVVEKLGADKEKEIRDEIKQDRSRRGQQGGNEVIITGNSETLCKDALSGRYFTSNVNSIKRIMNELSHRLMTDMWIPLNDVYFELGLETTKLGDTVGWHIDQVGSELIQPEFTTELTEDDRPCLVLDFNVEPKHSDRDY